ncbi:hypothetical protein GE09DRAFT_1207991 [Coniochaeta sp. 2T2.1]|nr:hypothetical protein GE09DRAFT_1207991 [Coniochaeta sp. 2T2.1]
MLEYCHWAGAPKVAGYTTHTSPSKFTITALYSRDGHSVLECWELTSHPVEAMSAINFEIGNTTKATWSIIEPRTIVGEAWAPTVQLSMILDGLIRITAPSPTSSNSSLPAIPATTSRNATEPNPASSVAYIVPGTLRSSLLIAADVKASSHIRGHYTEFPSDVPTVLVQVPFVGNRVPEHVVLHDGACR